MRKTKTTQWRLSKTESDLSTRTIWNVKKNDTDKSQVSMFLKDIFLKDIDTFKGSCLFIRDVNYFVK